MAYIHDDIWLMGIGGKEYRLSQKYLLKHTNNILDEIYESIDVLKGKCKKLYNRDTIIFIDEIHRFNKAQQDAFLPYVEKGSIILVGATTENPS
ncbi:unnamed protein product, partial [marine sediment metagenome]